MKITPVIGAAVAAVVVAAPGGAAAQTTMAKTPLAAKLTSCVKGTQSAPGTATFEGSMPQSTPVAKTMEMRFTLFERSTPTGAFAPVNPPGFGTWLKSAPGKGAFIFDKTVQNLAAPASYRVVIHYRWLGKHGKVIRRTLRVSKACIQPDPRPDLIIGRIEVAKGSDASSRTYTVNVRNKGNGDVLSPFSVALSVNGSPLPSQSVPSLSAGLVTPVQFVGPKCTAGTTIDAAADPDGAVTEADESNNGLSKPCPAGS